MQLYLIMFCLPIIIWLLSFIIPAKPHDINPNLGASQSKVLKDSEVANYIGASPPDMEFRYPLRNIGISSTVTIAVGTYSPSPSANSDFQNNIPIVAEYVMVQPMSQSEFSKSNSVVPPYMEDNNKKG